MEAKDNTLYPLIILFFLLGLVVGYVIHKPVTIEKIEYVNRTIEVPVIKEVEKIANVTATPISAVPTSTAAPMVSDFTVKNYDPSTDVPDYTIQLRNGRANPDTLSINSGNTVLIKITDSTLSTPLTLIVNSSYTQNLGKSGAVIVTFNKIGMYSLDAIIPSSNPNIIPRTYGEATISVN